MITFDRLLNTPMHVSSFFSYGNHIASNPVVFEWIFGTNSLPQLRLETRDVFNWDTLHLQYLIAMTNQVSLPASMLPLLTVNYQCPVCGVRYEGDPAGLPNIALGRNLSIARYTYIGPYVICCVNHTKHIAYAAESILDDPFILPLEYHVRII